MEKCTPFGVTVPLSRWCGVRAWELRNSPCGLLSVRATFFSYFDAVCTDGMIEPNSRLHRSSLSGSAAAPVTAPAAPTAPATAIPLPSKARRSIRPLPATKSSEGLRPRRLVVLMMSSLMERRHMRRSHLKTAYAASRRLGCPDQGQPFRHVPGCRAFRQAITKGLVTQERRSDEP